METNLQLSVDFLYCLIIVQTNILKPLDRKLDDFFFESGIGRK